MNIALDYTITARELFAFVPPSTNSRWSRVNRWFNRVACAVLIVFLSVTAWRAGTAGIDSSVSSNIELAAVLGAGYVSLMLFRQLMLFSLRNYSVHVSIDRDGVVLTDKHSVRSIPWSSFALRACTEISLTMIQVREAKRP